MANIANSEHVADLAVTITVDAVFVCFDEVGNHLSLKLSALVGIEADVVRLVVEVQSGLIQLAS
ncbi:Uncharacterised protein [Chlamydia trachomatis]|nr:Uncharacterised protein [Chlamydia trachomatis]